MTEVTSNIVRRSQPCGCERVWLVFATHTSTYRSAICGLHASPEEDPRYSGPLCPDSAVAGLAEIARRGF